MPDMAVLVRAPLNLSPPPSPPLRPTPITAPPVTLARPVDMPPAGLQVAHFFYGLGATAPVVKPVAVAPKPVVKPVAVAPKPVVKPVAVAPKPVVKPVAVAPKPVVKPVAVAPKPAAAAIPSTVSIAPATTATSTILGIPTTYVVLGAAAVALYLFWSGGEPAHKKGHR